MMIDKNQAIDSVIAFSDETPIKPNNTTKAPSRRPIPDIVTGMSEIIATTGIKLNTEINDIPIESPLDSI